MEEIKKVHATNQSYMNHSVPIRFSPYYHKIMGKSRDECKICRGRCDPGELRNGICFDCMLEEKKKIAKEKELDRLIRAKDYKQIEMEDILNGEK